jgi:hypothetical protein
MALLRECNTMGRIILKRHRIAGTLLVGSMLAIMLVVVATAYAPGHGAFKKTWDRTDKPIADQVLSGTWIWGPEGNTPVFEEQYVDAPGGTRMVQYFDKSRMEITNPAGDQNSPWYVTNGLLATELMTGRLQLGDNTFAYRQPAEINALGDLDAPNTPSYAALNRVSHLPPYAAGQTIDFVIDANGATSRDSSLARYAVTAYYLVPETNHQVARPFWTFMNSSRPVYRDGTVVSSEKLFENPFYATGFPVTEAYWVRTVVGGMLTDVLVQAFERRVLTYTPSNPAGWQIEAGNVGQHYYQWRYGSESESYLGTVYLVALDDDGASGPPVGCKDSLVGVKRYIEYPGNVEANITQTLQSLFAIGEQWYGQSGLYNSLHDSNLSVASVAVNDGHATVALEGTVAIGGVCDEPRIVGQIVLTVLNVPGVTSAAITLSGVQIH